MKETLKHAVAKFHLGRGGYARGGLAGCPAGGWPETEQAFRRIADALPLRDMRSYTVQQFVEACYFVDHAGRYQVREKGEG